MTTKNIFDYLKEIKESAKKYQDLFVLDIGTLPEDYNNKEEVIKSIPTIFVLGTNEDITKLYEWVKKGEIDIIELIIAFSDGIKILKKIHETNSIESLFSLPECIYNKLKKVFPKTISAIENFYKPIYLKAQRELAKSVEATSKEEKKEGQPQPQIIGFIIPKPKKERVSWKGIDLGEVDKGYDAELYGKMVAEHNLKWLRQRFSEEEIKKGIEYVKRRFPHLNPNTQLFWSTVENTILTKGWIEDEIFKD